MHAQIEITFISTDLKFEVDSVRELVFRYKHLFTFSGLHAKYKMNFIRKFGRGYSSAVKVLVQDVSFAGSNVLI